MPDYAAGAAPGSATRPFIMLPEGLGRLFSIDGMSDGPFSEHYEPIESHIASNPLHPDVSINPTPRLYSNDKPRMGHREQYPYVATTYSITELFRHWTKHSRLSAIIQPEQFIEIGEQLAARKGIVQGGMVKVSTLRGFIKGKAVVTKRLTTLKIAGKDIDSVGIPVHWGYEGTTRKGYLANILTPAVGEANSQTPEYKAFLVNLEKHRKSTRWPCNPKTSSGARLPTVSRPLPMSATTSWKWPSSST